MNIKQLEQELKQVEKLNFSHISYQELENRLKPIMLMGVVHHELKTGSSIIRVRPNEENECYCNENQISFISKKKSGLINEYGRANRPKQSIFYGTVSSQVNDNPLSTAIVEVIRPNTESFTYGVWEVIQDINLCSVFPVYKLSKKPKYIQDIGEKMLNKINTLERDDKSKTKIKLVTHFFSKQFSKQVTNHLDYLPTSIFSNIFISAKNTQENNCFGGISYRSTRLAAENAGINVAINPTVVKNCLKLKRVYFNSQNSFNCNFDIKGQLTGEENSFSFPNLICTRIPQESIECFKWEKYKDGK